MLAYILKRVLAMVPVVAILSVVVFLIVYLTPGDPASTLLGMEASAEDIAALNAQMGLDKPPVERFVSWAAAALQGDLGDSLFMDMPVTQAIAEHFVPTLSLALLAQLIAIVIAIPCGIVAALRRGTWADALLRTVSLLGAAVPGFLMGLLLMLAFAVKLRIFPVAGYEPLESGLAQHLRYLALPAIALGVVQAALLMRMTRSSLIDTLKSGYVRTARAKGLPEGRVVMRHALRNASLPILTAVGFSFGALLTGAVVIESIFNIPGLGQLVTTSITRRDYPVIQGVLLVIALLYSLVNLLIDILYGVLDPRARQWNR
jgi:peptide/nickel transport system permease protein